MNELLLCALRRRGKPGTAADLYDAAVALALAEGWQRRSWSSMSVQQAAALLKGMEKRGDVTRVGNRKEGGVDRPVWAPLALPYDLRAPMPPAPDPEGEEHPLHGTTNRQKFVLFDVMDATLALYARMQHDVTDLIQKHNRELADHAARAKRDLLAVGLSEVGS